MNFSNTPSEEEMSMEDILSSIRKYVSEEDEKKNASVNTPQCIEEEHYNNTDSVIKLQKSNIVSSDSIENSQPIVNVSTEEPLISYNEKSTLSENIVTNSEPTKKNPFGQLAEALTSYGKNKATSKPQEKKESALTIDQFLTRVTEEMIEKWIDKNLNNIVEKIVIREIEKMKSEE
ncbi:MAG: DUF2497 domain-containing protein [Alphaproteobacteria bacterium]|nr:DUF2497 domain-containing protein [Alphaproteobacteria bacterium]